jgi:hypothetical protein
MRARQRHFNPRNAGANLVLDARYINQANSTSISSWTDRSANSYTINQTTAANQPTFKTREINGNSAVQFDGTSDFLTGGDILDLGTNGVIIVSVARRDSGTGGALAGKSSQRALAGRYSLLRETSQFIMLYDRQGGGITAQLSESSTAPTIFSGTLERGVNLKAFTNGNQLASTNTGTPDSTSHNTSDEFFIGAYQNSTGTSPPASGLYWNGMIAQVIVLLSNTYNNPLKKRLEQSSAFSFKIACS